MRTEDIEAIRSPQKPKNANQEAAQKSNGAAKPDQTPLMGLTGPAQHGPFGSRFQDDPANPISEGGPFEVFQQRIEVIAQEIDRLRNNRIKAVNDLSRDGVGGHPGSGTSGQKPPRPLWAELAKGRSAHCLR